MTFNLIDLHQYESAPASVSRPAEDALPHPFAGVRVVAFDLDCTLIDIVQVKRRACEAAAWALADAGIDLDPSSAADDMLATGFEVGIDRHDVVDTYLERLLGRPDPRFAAIGRHAFARAEDQTAVPYPRAQRTLVELGRRGYALALVSDAPRDRVVSRLQSARLTPFFEPILALEDSSRGKADTEPYARLARLTTARPDEIVMVGDNPSRDVGSARAFGCRAILAEYGLQSAFASTRPEHAPDATIRWPDDLLSVLPEQAGAA